MPQIRIDDRLPFATAMFAAVLASTAMAQTPGPQYAITLYNSRDADPLFAGPVDFEPPPGVALIHETRHIEIGKGRGTLTLNGFPVHLDDTALSVGLQAGRVLSQRFDAESWRSERILERSVGRRVSVEQSLGETSTSLTGELLSANLPLSLRLDDGSIVTINDYSRVQVLSPPAGFNALPQLRLDVDSERAGTQTVQLTYPSRGLAWRADYLARLAPGPDCRLDFSGFAQIANRSGHGFTSASVRLVANGSLRTHDMEPGVERQRSKADQDRQNVKIDDYRLDDPVDIPDGSIQQVALTSQQRRLHCTRERLYVGKSLRAQSQRVPITDPGYGRGGNRRVREALAFVPDNARSLPAGRIRALALDERDGTPTFIAEQDIAAISAGQRLDVMLDAIPTLEGERTVGGFKLDDSGLGLSETISIVLRNHDDEATDVRVIDHLYRWTQWNIAESSLPYQPHGTDAIEFEMHIPANSESRLSYRVHYRWTERFQ